MAEQKKTCKTIGRKGKKPAQQKYVRTDRLLENKVKNLLKQRTADGKPRFESKREARDFWLSVRKRRVTKSWESKGASK